MKKPKRPAKKRALAKRRASASPVDAYLAPLPKDVRAALERLRGIIRKAVPGATEVISYGIPTFKLERMVVAFGAFKKHCTFFTLSTAVLRDLAADVEGYDSTPSGIHFTPDDPLPAKLVTKLVKARLAENAARTPHRRS